MKHLTERFFKHVLKSDGCWVWTGAMSIYGYGLFWFNGASVGAHRMSYVMAHGLSEFPPLLVCHHCDNRPCVNPAHLYLGTSLDNAADMMRRGRHPQARKTHCKHGHEFSTDNLYIRPSNGERCCIICRELRSQKHYARHRERILAINRMHYALKKQRVLERKGR